MQLGLVVARAGCCADSCLNSNLMHARLQLPIELKPTLNQLAFLIGFRFPIWSGEQLRVDWYLCLIEHRIDHEPSQGQSLVMAVVAEVLSSVDT